jgi:hypothetical protein
MATNLVEYGIQEESSDVRIHVCPQVRRLYVFRTNDAKVAIKAANVSQRNAYQLIDGVRVLTAVGFVVAWDSIANCIQIPLRNELWHKYCIDANMPEAQKGYIAEQMVIAGLRLGVIPLPLDVQASAQFDEQMAGVDIVIPATTIQVKCDYRGGSKELGGTGNLFLQVSEYNPKKQK